MSGGVDSAVAALLMKEAGHEIVGLFMRSGISSAGQRSCCSAADARDARRVAARLGIPFYALDLSAGFGELVDSFVGAYNRGRTPNPCVECNNRLKFGHLIDAARQLGDGVVATGHYVRRLRRGEGHVLTRAVDRAKDQSYYLFGLTPAQIESARFPLGELTKDRVRKLAADAGLPVADKPESQEICFVPGDYRRLLAERDPDAIRSGEIRDTAGRVLGRHDGYQFFTIGQRRGLGVALGRRAYVVAIDPATASVVVGEEEDLLATGLTMENVQWTGEDEPDVGWTRDVEVKIRAGARPASARLEVLPGARARLAFVSPVRAVAPGQAAVCYEGDVVVCGGWISS